MRSNLIPLWKDAEKSPREISFTPPFLFPILPESFPPLFSLPLIGSFHKFFVFFVHLLIFWNFGVIVFCSRLSRYLLCKGNQQQWLVPNRRRVNQLEEKLLVNSWPLKLHVKVPHQPEESRNPIVTGQVPLLFVKFVVTRNPQSC
uniref:Transmembrane protein n=1 Tax=Cacopsylla melanoneura TaxID=428564 RepID=A0A8D8QZJ8_9HEMI